VQQDQPHPAAAINIEVVKDYYGRENRPRGIPAGEVFTYQHVVAPLSSPLQIHDKVIMEAANRWRLLHRADASSRPLFNEVGRCQKGSPKLTKDNFPTARLRSPSTTF
jgi:hypothetical protein